MTYLALARKWRPRTFLQLLGQDHIKQALVNSLNTQRLHHAYLFTGTRGVGKTSIARLFAKHLNCESGISAEACLTCPSCLAIESGSFIDLIEIDGASRTRIEDTRDILENVQYLPSSGRFKIYIIDEVHMLSQHSFNALLKTLEEPPSHVKFLLATTDPQKLPVTVLSRCLHFNLRPISENIIKGHLQSILVQEQINFEDNAISLIAHHANGSMRDALSLLDQGIACSSELLSRDLVRNMLGHTRENYALQLLTALAAFDGQELLNISKAIANEGGNFHYVLDELLSHLHQIALLQSLPEHNALTTPDSSIHTLAQQFTEEDVQLFYQIGINSINDIHIAPTPAIGFEMMLLRMYTFQPETITKSPKLAHEQISECITNDTVVTNTPAITNLASSRQDTVNPSIKNSLVPESIVSIKEQPALASPPINWGEIISKLKLTGLALNAAENAELVRKIDHEVVLSVAKGHQSIFSTMIINRIEDELSTYFHETIKIKLEVTDKVSATPAQQKKAIEQQNQLNAQQSLENDIFFQQLKQEFAAELVKNSVIPKKDSL